MLFSGIEPLYDSVLYLGNSTFQSITIRTIKSEEEDDDSGEGGIIKFQADTSSTFSSLLSQKKFSVLATSTSYTISTVNNSYSNISTSTGGLLYWESQTKPVSVLLANSTFEDFDIITSGIIIYSSYTPNSGNSANQQNSVSVLNVSNCSFSRLSADEGGVFYIEGAVNLFNLIINESYYDTISAGGNGSVIHIHYFTTQNTTEVTLRLLSDDNNQQKGTISMLNSEFLNTTADNGAILFEDSPSDFLSIVLENSQIYSLIAQERGGVFYVNNPTLTISNNTFSDCYSNTSGSILYSTSSVNISSSSLLSSNSILNSSNEIPLIASAPTNLLIEVINTTTSTYIQLENYQNLSDVPIISGLAYNSLQSLTLIFTLVSSGDQDVMTVADYSTDASISLAFSSLGSGSSNQYSEATCYNSTCVLKPSDMSDITLIGLANELIPINVTYTSQVIYTITKLISRIEKLFPRRGK